MITEMPDFQPTDEQDQIVQEFKDNKNLIVQAGAGCLAGDTVININRAGNGRAAAIEHVVRQLSGAKLGRGIRRWDSNIATGAARAEEGVCRLGEIKHAWFSGMKETFELRTHNGRMIRATESHPFMMSGGSWAVLSEIKPGNLVCVNVGRSRRQRRPKKQYRSVATKFHPFQVSDSNTRPKFKVPLHRAIIEAEVNGLSIDEFISILRSDPVASAGMHFLDASWHVHHRDGDSLNNERSNLELMTSTEHFQMHAHEGFKNHVLWQVGEERVESVAKVAEEPTYDIEMSDDPHNFLANGFVVHNTGKSSTTMLLGDAKRDQTGVCLYFNKSAAAEAREKFPWNMACSTAHSIAYRAVGKEFSGRFDGQRVTAKALADGLGIPNRFFRVVPSNLGSVSRVKDISSWKLASLAKETVVRFCHSDDRELHPRHVPWQKHVANMDELRAKVFPYAKKVWADAQDPNGWMKYEQDYYFKMWALSDSKIMADFLCVDEAQDTNPALGGVVARQGIQTVLIGDSRQQLFGWRGATDIMDTFEADETLYLTQSFRFGQPIADEANRWLAYLGTDLRLRGLEDRDSTLEPIETPDVVLCRTNAEVIERAFLFQQSGKKVHIVGERMLEEIRSFAAACASLQAGEKTSHRELSIFQTWDDVMTYIHDEQPADSFGTFMRLVENFGTAKIQQVVANCVDDKNSKGADVSVTTVHKVKGLEWDRVVVDGGILPDNTEDISRETLMLAYVAVTRAKFKLDCTALESYHRRRALQSRVANALGMK